MLASTHHACSEVKRDQGSCPLDHRCDRGRAAGVRCDQSGFGIWYSGGIVLIIAGALLLVCPFIIGRIERLSVSTTGLELQLSREISDLGAPKTAQILDRTDLAKFAESYAFIHDELNAPAYRPAKVHLQDLLVARAAAISPRDKIDASEARTLFKNGSPMMRVLALGIMQGDPSLADGATILSAISESRSANEQYQGLKLARLSWNTLARSDRQAIKSRDQSQSLHTTRNGSASSRGSIASSPIS